MVKKAKVLFEYVPENDDELALAKGDIITVLQEEIYDGWHEGELNGAKGVFPSNFVQIFEEEEAPKPKKMAPPAGGIGDIMHALHKKNLEKQATQPSVPEPQPEQHEEAPAPAPVPEPVATPSPAPVEPASTVLRCQATHAYTKANDDELSFAKGDVIEIVAQEHDDWWTGRLNGQEGWFPSNFVKVLKEGAAPAKLAAMSTTSLAPEQPTTEHPPMPEPAPVEAPAAVEEEPAPAAEPAQQQHPPVAGGKKLFGVPTLPMGPATAVGSNEEPEWKKALKRRKEAAAAAGGMGSSTALNAASPDVKKADTKPAWMKKQEEKLKMAEAEEQHAHEAPAKSAPAPEPEPEKPSSPAPAPAAEDEQSVPETEPTYANFTPSAKPPTATADDAAVIPRTISKKPDVGTRPKSEIPNSLGSRPTSKYGGVAIFPGLGPKPSKGLDAAKEEPQEEKGSSFDTPADSGAVLTSATKSRPKKAGGAKPATRATRTAVAGTDAEKFAALEKMIHDLKHEIQTLREELRIERRARETLEDRVLALEE